MKRISTLILGLCLITLATGCCCGRYSRCVGWGMDPYCGGMMDPWGCGMGSCGGCGGGCDGGMAGGGCCGGGDGMQAAMGGGCQSGNCQGGGVQQGGGCQSGNCGNQAFNGMSFSGTQWTQMPTNMMSSPSEPMQVPPATMNQSQTSSVPGPPLTPIHPHK